MFIKKIQGFIQGYLDPDRQTDPQRDTGANRQIKEKISHVSKLEKRKKMTV